MDDKEIKKLLSELPTIKDHRSKEVVLARLKEDERLQKPPKHKKLKRWLPAFVAIASILIFSLIIPSLFRGGEEENIESALDKPALSTLEKDDSLDNIQNESETYLSEDTEESAILESGRGAEFEGNIVLADELGDMRTFQIGLVSDEIVIPVTFLIPAERILADFSEGEPNTVQLYNQYAAAIPEEKLGFDNYHPYKGEVMDDSIKLSERITPVTYYKYVMPSSQIFLVPHYGSNDHDTVEKALLGMKKPQNNRVESLVPEHVKYDVLVKEGTAIISFKETLDLSQMNHEDAIAMIEGFILTAHHYQSTVRLENVLQNSLGKYNFNTNLPEPVAVNPLNFIPE